MVVKASATVEMTANAPCLAWALCAQWLSASHPRGLAEALAVKGALSCESAVWMGFLVALAFIV